VVWKDDNYFDAEGKMSQQLQCSHLTAQELGRLAISVLFSPLIKKNVTQLSVTPVLSENL
jgi:hypothetical protein